MKPIDQSNPLAVHRLTALWAFSEAGLGGLMHALKIPFTGLLVGGIAIIIITLIAHFSVKEKYADIIKAMVIVLLVKLVVSPHSPPTAYLAVIFQAFSGALLYSSFLHPRISAMILGIVAMVESALQKLLVLTIWFGKDLWEAVDIYYNNITMKLGFAGEQWVQISYWLIGGFIGLYTIGGIIIGWVAGKLPEEIDQALEDDEITALRISAAEEDIACVKPKRRNSLSRYSIYLGIGIAIFIAFVFLQPDDRQISKGVLILVRASLAIAAWFLIISPVIRQLLKFLLSKQKGKYASEVEHIITFLPQLRSVVAHSWKLTKKYNWLYRWKPFLIHIIVFSLTHHYQPTNK